MNKIYLTSDLHLGHDREFIWKARGFTSVDEMNETIVQKWNETVSTEDDVYILGDVILGDPDNIEYVKRLNGKLHIVLGNHDTSNREKMYRGLPNVVEVAEVGIRLKYKKHHFVLTHYHMMTGNLDDKDKGLKARIINLCGHSHTIDKYQDMDKGIIYHCEGDAHDCYPILIDDIIQDLYNWTKNNILSTQTFKEV